MPGMDFTINERCLKLGISMYLDDSTCILGITWQDPHTLRHTQSSWPVRSELLRRGVVYELHGRFGPVANGFQLSELLLRGDQNRSLHHLAGRWWNVVIAGFHPSNAVQVGYQVGKIDQLHSKFW